MAEHPHHHDPIEENIDTHPVKLAIGVVIGAAALIIGILMLAQFAVGMYGNRSMKDEPAMSKDAVAKRLAPVAKVVIDPNAAANTAAPAAAQPATSTATVVAAAPAAP